MGAMISCFYLEGNWVNMKSIHYSIYREWASSSASLNTVDRSLMCPLGELPEDVKVCLRSWTSTFLQDCWLLPCFHSQMDRLSELQITTSPGPQFSVRAWIPLWSYKSFCSGLAILAHVLKHGMCFSLSIIESNKTECSFHIKFYLALPPPPPSPPLKCGSEILESARWKFWKKQRQLPDFHMQENLANPFPRITPGRQPAAWTST